MKELEYRFIEIKYNFVGFFLENLTVSVTSLRVIILMRGHKYKPKMDRFFD